MFNATAADAETADAETMVLTDSGDCVDRKAMRRVFDISSNFADSRDVQARIMQDVSDAGYDDESAFGIRIALEEAIVNAIRHGNRFDASKRVAVVSEVTPKKIEITVEDQGAGFQRKVIPDPTASENLCRPNGRGILLIESYMDSVTWELGGKRVRMVRKAK